MVELQKINDEVALKTFFDSYRFIKQKGGEENPTFEHTQQHDSSGQHDSK